MYGKRRGHIVEISMSHNAVIPKGKAAEKVTRRIRAPARAPIRAKQMGIEAGLRARMSVRWQPLLPGTVDIVCYCLYISVFLCCKLTILVCVGNQHGSAMHTIDYSSKLGENGIGGRCFPVKACIANLVDNHKYDRERAQKMCFAVGLTHFFGR